MRRRLCTWLAVVMAYGLGLEALAVDTNIDVRVLSKGAKFIGTGVAGAEITIRDAETSELLARGQTVGNSGNDRRIMVESWPRHAPLSTPTSAVFRATLDLDEPRQVVVAARGPLSQPQSTAVATVTQWMLPGKHITGGDGLTLELPGFSVDILYPPARRRVPAEQERIELRANVIAASRRSRSLLPARSGSSRALSRSPARDLTTSPCMRSIPATAIPESTGRRSWSRRRPPPRQTRIDPIHHAGTPAATGHTAT
jgi:hypothetical protein